MKFEVSILGSGSAIPKLDRRSTSQVVNHNERYFMIDCAEGTQMQLRKYKLKIQRVEAIFISHLHGDHYLGLFSYLQTMSLLGRKAPLKLYAEPALKEIIDKITEAGGGNKFLFPFEFIPLHFDEPKLIHETNTLEIWSFPLKHRIKCCGFLFKEKPKQKKLIASMLEAYKVPYYYRERIKNGEDFVSENGSTVKNSELTEDAPKSYSYAYCSDTAFKPDLANFLNNIDVMYHEATFLNEDEVKAKKTYHSTTGQAAEIAKLCGVKRLYTGHISARYFSAEPFRSELKAAFENSYVVNDGDLIKLY